MKRAWLVLSVVLELAGVTGIGVAILLYHTVCNGCGAYDPIPMSMAGAWAVAAGSLIHAKVLRGYGDETK